MECSFCGDRERRDPGPPVRMWIRGAERTACPSCWRTIFGPVPGQVPGPSSEFGVEVCRLSRLRRQDGTPCRIEWRDVEVFYDTRRVLPGWQPVFDPKALCRADPAYPHPLAVWGPWHDRILEPKRLEDILWIRTHIGWRVDRLHPDAFSIWPGGKP